MKKNIIALLLIILPLDILILGIFSDLYLLAYLPMIIGYIIYICNSNKNKLTKILITIGFFSMFISLLSFNNLSTLDGGIDSIGEALVLAAAYRFGNLISKIIALILLIIDNKKYIFRKKVIIPFIVVVLLLGAIYFICSVLHTFLTTIKVDKTIPTVKDFEEELIERELISNYSDYRLYGIKKEFEKGITLNFKENSTEQFPLYIYVADKSLNDGEKQWLIYYINGEIYAIWGCLFEWTNVDNIKEEKIIFDYPYSMKTENDKITTYNVKKNRFELGEHVSYMEYNYYSQNTSDASVFIDIPEITNEELFIIKQVERIDSKSLNW